MSLIANTESARAASVPGRYPLITTLTPIELCGDRSVRHHRGVWQQVTADGLRWEDIIGAVVRDEDGTILDMGLGSQTLTADQLARRTPEQQWREDHPWGQW